jgi:uncharacterized protein YjbI with pentapeptide repeats
MLAEVAAFKLGSDKAPVRLGGLSALERLAQDNPAHRQTIVNVICAYLCMPFSPTAPAGKPEPGAIEAREVRAGEAEASTGAIGGPELGGWQQERQVRLTAQRILAEHLRDDRAKVQRSAEPASPRFWPGIRLDLAGATLIDFIFDGGVTADARFDGATFSGTARFDGAIFGDARFRGATFDLAVFSGATFNGVAMFFSATFADSWFRGATFNGGADFSGATFNGRARFEGAAFNGEAWFDEVTFNGLAGFAEATFSDRAYFAEATFSGNRGLVFKRSRVLSPDTEHVWPTGWRLEADGRARRRSAGYHPGARAKPS